MRMPKEESDNVKLNLGDVRTLFNTSSPNSKRVK